jgi:hypothetical protein
MQAARIEIPKKLQDELNLTKNLIEKLKQEKFSIGKKMLGLL